MNRLRAYLLMLCLLPAGVFAADTATQAEYQFWHNAKLAGRALACADAAGKGSIRSASRGLAAQLAGDETVAQLMQEFDAKVRLHRRFAQRASPSHRGCDRNAAAIKQNLRTTQVIAPQD